MVRWSEPAKIDLKLIHDFIYKDSKFYARKIAGEILDKSRQLDDFPSKGRIVPEIKIKIFVKFLSILTD